MARSRVKGGADSMSFLNIMLIIFIVLIVVVFVYYVYLWWMNQQKMMATKDVSGNKVKMASITTPAKEGMNMMGMFKNKDKKK
jgi:flagellar basal body-associated protein FliL